jgi:hypothetical protein
MLFSKHRDAAAPPVSNLPVSNLPVRNLPVQNLPVQNLDDSIGGLLVQYLLMAALTAVAMFALVAI